MGSGLMSSLAGQCFGKNKMGKLLTFSGGKGYMVVHLRMGIEGEDTCSPSKCPAKNSQR